MTDKRAAAPSSTARPNSEFTDRERADAAQLVAVLKVLVDPLRRAMAPQTEVVLHDLTRLPQSIVAISGDLTGRSLDGPATDLGIRTFNAGWSEHLIGYRTQTPAGVPMRSSSVFFRSASGRAVVCLCLNTDISDALAAAELMASITATEEAVIGDLGDGVVSERFPGTVDELAHGMLAELVVRSGVTVENMKKEHKIAVVRQLRDRGFFTMREAVTIAADELRVGRHTIYNYLNELGD